MTCHQNLEQPDSLDPWKNLISWFYNAITDQPHPRQQMILRCLIEKIIFRLWSRRGALQIPANRHPWQVRILLQGSSHQSYEIRHRGKIFLDGFQAILSVFLYPLTPSQFLWPYIDEEVFHIFTPRWYFVTSQSDRQNLDGSWWKCAGPWRPILCFMNQSI